MWADETGLLAAWAGRLLGIPVIVSILGGELVGLRDIHYGLQRSRFSRWIVGQALHGANRVIVPSGYVQTLLNASGYHVPAEKQVRLTLGVDAARFTPSKTLTSAGRLIHVGSLIPVKDQPTLLRALALLEPDITLDIIGTGAEQERLQTLARKLGINERVRFVGAVAHPELPAYYQQAAVHVLSSRHDASPLTALEAAACGLPTVSTAVGTVPDHPALGVTVPVGDAPALAAGVQALLDNPQRRAAAGRDARAWVEQELTIEHTAERLRALYAELAQQKAGT
jgi:glycosyltransferase involved in cell wall biosynthesis